MALFFFNQCYLMRLPTLFACGGGALSLIPRRCLMRLLRSLLHSSTLPDALVT